MKKYPQIIQLEFIQKLSPNISWGILPETGIIPFLDLSNIQQGIVNIPEVITEVEETPEEEEEAEPEEEQTE